MKSACFDYRSCLYLCMYLNSMTKLLFVSIIYDVELLNLNLFLPPLALGKYIVLNTNEEMFSD